jgi:small subunit ribosomal protein S16
MSLKIRLRQQGCTNNVVYRIVVADSRSPRDGKFVENIGWYNPKAKEEINKCQVHPDRLLYWMTKGAQLGTTVEALMKKIAPEIISGLKQAKLAKKNSKKANA